MHAKVFFIYFIFFFSNWQSIALFSLTQLYFWPNKNLNKCHFTAQKIYMKLYTNL